jgi:hypothetical protein
VFGGGGKRVKSARSWIWLSDDDPDDRGGLSDGKDECTPAISNRAADSCPERVRMAPATPAHMLTDGKKTEHAKGRVCAFSFNIQFRYRGSGSQ